ncbi:hypothetical protein LAD12857_24580 [Lacrimispora amygdalina]|uniref:Uncharacterized protein n=1 Tax=Lacrimispora amygdalina TaxID=253257 RepID=A0ABQ5M6I0_9FIRM
MRGGNYPAVPGDDPFVVHGFIIERAMKGVNGALIVKHRKRGCVLLSGYFLFYDTKNCWDFYEREINVDRIGS